MTTDIASVRAEDIRLLQNFFKQHVQGADASCLNEGTLLLGDGLLDSLAVIQLMIFMGTELGVEIDDDDFTQENLATVGSLLDFVARKRQGMA